MNKEVTLLVAEDDPGHLKLLINNLRRSGVQNKIMTFEDGLQITDFLEKTKESILSNIGESYLLLLDIRMPKIDGIQVLKRIKSDNALKVIPVIMLTTADDPKCIDYSYKLGCSTYIVKPVDYDHFSSAINKLGMFLSVIEVPGSVKLLLGEN